MMRGVAPNVAVYLLQGAVDMRMSFDRLSALMYEQNWSRYVTRA
jgi:hypothetical protein